MGIQKHFSEILDVRKNSLFFWESDFMVDVRFELTTNDSCPAVDAIREVLVRWAKG